MGLYRIDTNVLMKAAGTKNNKPTHKLLGAIIGIVVGVVALIIGVVAIFCIRSRRRKARQGTILRETGEAEMDDESRPMVQRQDEMVGVPMPRPLMLQAGGAYFPPPGETMYGGGEYGKGVTMEDDDEKGHQGTEFYRNQ